jgi:Family of unknown function (DUF6335)
MARKPARKAKTQNKKKTVRRAGSARPVARKRSAQPKKKGASAPTRRSKAPMAKTPKRSTASRGKAPAPDRKGTATRAKGKRPRQLGGTGREATLSQTPATGRSVQGRTNPMPTKRSTGTAAGAGDSRRIPALERERKQLREVEESVPSPPSSLNMDRHGSAARTGRAVMRQAKKDHTEAGPSLTGGDVDADWEDAYAVGDEAPGGDNPTPDQDVVDEIGAALGVTYQDDEELKASDKITERDKHRWELDPASAEDYNEHDKD